MTQRYQQLGDLIQANLYQIKKGDTQTTVTDYFDPEQKPVTISLDPALSPAQNAQKYYKEYRKAKTARELLGGLIQQNQEEIVYLDTIFDELARASRESDLNAIREELEQQGYLRKVRRKLKPDKPLPPMEFVTEDGFTVLCGRNNKQNDQLTLKTARNYDVWFHTKDIPGSHVILQSQGERPAHSGTLHPPSRHHCRHPFPGTGFQPGAGGLHLDQIRKEAQRRPAGNGDLHPQQNPLCGSQPSPLRKACQRDPTNTIPRFFTGSGCFCFWRQKESGSFRRNHRFPL